MIEYGSQHARWPYQFGFENKGRVEPEYEGRHRRGLPRNGMVIWHSRAQVFAEITAAGMYRTVE